MSRLIALFVALVFAPPTTTQQPSARPAFKYSIHGGCHNIMVFASNTPSTEVLFVWLNLDRNALPTAQKPLTLDLSKLPPRDMSKVPPPNRVEVQVYPSDVHFIPCSDVVRGTSGGKLEDPVVWVAQSGTITVTATPPKSESAQYPVTVQITGAVFEGPNGERVTAPRILTVKTLAGALVGG